MLLDSHAKPHNPWLLPNPSGRAAVLRQLRARANATDDRVLDAAQFYCDWRLVLALCRQRIELEGEHAALSSRLGLAALRLGALEAARSCRTRAALLDPSEPGGRQLHRELVRWEPWRQRFPASSPEDLASERLRLEPLGPHHWADLWWQYQDPDIARLCCLPAFRHSADWQHWLELEHTRRGSLMFAVLERDWGFCGVAALMIHRRVGFLYYWLGRDFRGRGLASEAVVRLLTTAQARWSMHTCYAKVFEHNAPSRRLLARAGFRQLSLRLQAPHGDQLLYRRGVERDAAEIHTELRQLFADIQCELRLAPLVLSTAPGRLLPRRASSVRPR